MRLEMRAELGQLRLGPKLVSLERPNAGVLHDEGQDVHDGIVRRSAEDVASPQERSPFVGRGRFGLQNINTPAGRLSSRVAPGSRQATVFRRSSMQDGLRSDPAGWSASWSLESRT